MPGENKSEMAETGSKVDEDPASSSCSNVGNSHTRSCNSHPLNVGAGVTIRSWIAGLIKVGTVLDITLRVGPDGLTTPVAEDWRRGRGDDDDDG